jgi:hypothetical protein
MIRDNKKGARFMDEKTNGNNGTPVPTTLVGKNVESEVLRRYREGARQAEPGLCCSTQYDSRFIELLPQEIIEKDYGCGDPSRYVGEGETVIDLGSGAGKICYILSQKVGPGGSVIGVDFNHLLPEKLMNKSLKHNNDKAFDV